MQFVDRCNLKLSKVDNPFPDFAVPEGETLFSYFEKVCRDGLQKRLDTSDLRTCARAACSASPSTNITPVSNARSASSRT